MADALYKAENSKLFDAELKEVIYRMVNLTDIQNLEYLLQQVIEKKIAQIKVA